MAKHVREQIRLSRLAESDKRNVSVRNSVREREKDLARYAQEEIGNRSHRASNRTEHIEGPNKQRLADEVYHSKLRQRRNYETKGDHELLRELDQTELALPGEMFTKWLTLRIKSLADYDRKGRLSVTMRNQIIDFILG